MALFRSERGIGRGEAPESQLEAPFLVAAMLFFGLVLFVQHQVLQNDSVTVALAVSGMVFGITVFRVEFGVYILTIAMLLSPEIEFGDVAAGERAFTMRYDDLLIIVIFLGVMLKLAYDGHFTLWRPSPINLAILGYYTVCIISTLLALDRNLGAWDRRTAFFVMLKMLQFYMVFWLVGHAIKNRMQVRRQLALYFLVAVVVSAYGIYSIGTTPRVSAPFETGGTEPNTLGGYLVVTMCVALGLGTQAPTYSRKMLFFALFALCGMPLLYTLSRASYMAIFVGGLTVATVSRKFIILAMLFGVLALSPLIMPQDVIDRVAYTIQPDQGQEVVGGVKVDKSTGERFLVWRKVEFILTLAPIYTLFGGGVSWESVLDSQYARVILETGLVGLLAFLFLQYRIAKTLREAYRWTDDWVGRGLAMGMFAATLALMVHSLGTISFLIVRIMMPFWVLTAMCVFVRNDAVAMHWSRLQARRKVLRDRVQPATDTNAEPPPAPGSTPGVGRTVKA